jgi:hypothetical protein
MSRRAAATTQADITRVLRAVHAAKVKMRVEVYPDGRIVIVPDDASDNVVVPIIPAALDQSHEIVL